jgi:hypothetical protein
MLSTIDNLYLKEEKRKNKKEKKKGGGKNRKHDIKIIRNESYNQSVNRISSKL